MSFHSSYGPNPQSSMLLGEIEKAFKQVNLICKEFMEVKKPSLFPSKQNFQPPPKFNFNNYKGNFNSKNEIAKKNKSFDVDEENFGTNDENSGLMKNQDKKKQFHTKSFESNRASKDQEIKSKEQKATNKLMTKISSNAKNEIPPPPKAPISPYFVFYREKKDAIRSQLPEMSVSEISSAAAKVWKSLSEEEREPFNKKFFQEKERYTRLMKAYVAKYPNYREMHKKGVQEAGEIKK